MFLPSANRRVYSKPRGYTGDYPTIHWIYEAEPSETGEVGRLIHRCGLDLKCMRAVRNRRNLVSRQIAIAEKRWPRGSAWSRSPAVPPLHPSTGGVSQ
jgi:hypothetical protein